MEGLKQACNSLKLVHERMHVNNRCRAFPAAAHGFRCCLRDRCLIAAWLLFNRGKYFGEFTLGEYWTAGSSSNDLGDQLMPSNPACRLLFTGDCMGPGTGSRRSRLECQDACGVEGARLEQCLLFCLSNQIMMCFCDDPVI